MYGFFKELIKYCLLQKGKRPSVVVAENGQDSVTSVSQACPTSPNVLFVHILDFQNEIFKLQYL